MRLHNILNREIPFGKLSRLLTHGNTQFLIIEKRLQTLSQHFGILNSDEITVYTILNHILATDGVGRNNRAAYSRRLNQRLGYPLAIIRRERNDVRLFQQILHIRSMAEPLYIFAVAKTIQVSLSSLFNRGTVFEDGGV